MSDQVVTLRRSVADWNSPANNPTFRSTLIEEIESIGADHPVLQSLLQAGLTQTSAVAKAPLAVC